MMLALLACGVGTYKSGLGNATCVSCAPNSVATAVGQAQCLCDVGYGGIDPTACAPCGVNSYKTTQANTACTNCPANAVTTTTGASQLVQCVCALGYTGVNGGPCLGKNAPFYF